MMKLAKQIYVAAQFINCMQLAGVKFTPEDLLAYINENVK